MNEVPLEIKKLYLFRALREYCERDREKIDSLRGLMEEVMAVDNSLRTKLLKIGFRYPWLFVKLVNMRDSLLQLKSKVIS